MTGLVPQVVDRPGASTYRARKPPISIPVRLCGMDADGILGVRCHDTDVALLAVIAGVDDTTIAPDLAELLLADEVGVVLLWVRWIPDDYEHPDGPGSWERETRGTVGATPAVLFTTPATIDRLDL